jgi:hypothetical protein
MYVLDDISPLRNKDKGINPGLHLFKPYYAVRGVQNAVFQYVLDKDVKDLKIEILNNEGKTIQTFVGALPKDKKDSSAVVEDEDDRKPVPPSIKTGLNSFEWNLKYPSASYFKGMIFWSAPVYVGPTAVPGNYQVRITAGEIVKTEQFEIRLDPRVNDVTIADMQEKFNLSIQIRDQVSRANDAVIKIRSIKEKLAPKDANLLAQLSAVEENLYQVRNQSSQDPLNFPIKLNNKLASLMRVVESGDYKPTAGSYTVFEELKGELDVEITRLEQILQSKAAKKYVMEDKK